MFYLALLYVALVCFALLCFALLGWCQPQSVEHCYLSSKLKGCYYINSDSSTSSLYKSCLYCVTPSFNHMEMTDSDSIFIIKAL